MSTALGNQLLKDAEVELAAKMTPQDRDDYRKIVAAGLDTALRGGADSPMAQMVRTTKDPVRDCVDGAISLCLHMRSESKGVMPMKAMIPAAVTLMLYALDFVDKAGVLPVGKPELNEATRMFTVEIFRRVGITNEQLRNATIEVQAISQDPAAMRKIDIATITAMAPGRQAANLITRATKWLE